MTDIKMSHIRLLDIKVPSEHNSLIVPIINKIKQQLGIKEITCWNVEQIIKYVELLNKEFLENSPDHKNYTSYERIWYFLQHIKYDLRYEDSEYIKLLN